MHTHDEKLCRKGSHSSSASGSNRLVRFQICKRAMGWCTAQWKMLLFCAIKIYIKIEKKGKHVSRASNIISSIY